MFPQSRRKDPTVIEQLLATPQEFEFFQAVRLLQIMSQLCPQTIGAKDYSLDARNPIAKYSPPTTEFLRFKGHHSFKFPESEIIDIKEKTKTDGGNQWAMQVNFMGLTGCMGVMPFHYTELILQRLKQKDEALASFLDLFNHRSISLFFQSAIKYRLPIEYERKKIYQNTRNINDTQTQALLSLTGLGTRGLNDRLEVKDESLLFYSGLLTQQIKNCTSLTQMLQDYFDIPIKIQEFVGQWQELIPDTQTRMTSRILPKGQNAQLGVSAMLGHKAWFAQGKIKIYLGPLNRPQFDRFAPGTRALKALNEMVRMYLGLEHDYEFVIEVRRKDIPEKISLSKSSMPIMGWNTWLTNSKKHIAGGSETLMIRVPAKRLQ